MELEVRTGIQRAERLMETQLEPTQLEAHTI